MNPTSPRTSRAVAAALSVTAALGIALISPAAANASWVPAQVSGKASGATLRDCYHPRQSPSTSCKSVAFLSPGTGLRVVCQKVGQRVTGPYGSSEIWDYVVVSGGPNNGKEGMVADANIYTGSNGLVAEICT
nr:hypothetical protein [Rhodococcus sp. 06-1059B-a]